MIRTSSPSTAVAIGQTQPLEPSIAPQRTREGKANGIGICRDPLLDSLHHRGEQLDLRMLQEALLVELLLEAFDLSFELLVLAREQLGLEDDLPAMAHQGRTHSCAGAPAHSIVSTVTPASSSSSSAARAPV